jgi:hypothetical protein
MRIFSATSGRVNLLQTKLKGRNNTKIPTEIRGRITRDSENAVYYEQNVFNYYLINISMQWNDLLSFVYLTDIKE